MHLSLFVSFPFPLQVHCSDLHNSILVSQMVASIPFSSGCACMSSKSPDFMRLPIFDFMETRPTVQEVKNVLVSLHGAPKTLKKKKCFN